MSNASTVVGDPIDSAVATVPNLCRISGYLRDIHGNALPGVGLNIVNVYNPAGIVSDTLILQERTTVRSNKDGYVEFDLLRSACVTINLPNRTTEVNLHLVVPDAPSSDLVDFLFPYLVEVQFVTVDPASVAVDSSLAIEMIGILSNQVEVDLDGATVKLVSSNDSVLKRTSGLTFRGISAGSAQVSVDSVDTAALKLLLADDEKTPITLFEQPDVVLPAPLTVNVI